jgi:hypothetical protein
MAHTFIYTSYIMHKKIQPSGGTSSSDLEEDPDVLNVDVLVSVVLVLILCK